ncbi:MAG: Gfo/Idh/MocA family oxidoreductase [Phycisphaerae bacterium]|nr:Gfo/Idh/MocA family oxidoreductase [Phycisphaerae bacterium]MDW8261218.1 Gfo/Idh/MocA family oxidoreductase [Phycisphaerales bacterium]
MKKHRLGVLGLGEGRSIMSAALNSELWELAQICDLNEDLCRERAAEFRFDNYTTRAEELFSNPDVDVVGIYTPDPLHAEHILRSLECGKHVICTKPLIDNLKDAPALLEAQRKSGRLVFVGQSSRFFAPMIRQRADFEAGKHGNIFSVEAEYNADNRWFLQKSWARAGGLKWLYGGLSHPVDLVRWYLPDIMEVMGYGMLTENGRKVGLQHDDSMHFIMKTRSGRIARVSGCYSAPPQPHMRDSHMTCVVRGENGTSQADYYDLRYSTHFKGEGCVQYDMEHQAPYYFRFGGRGHHAGEYQNYIEYFARCLAANQIPKPDLIEGIVTVAVMTAMERSLETARPVRVDAILDEFGLSRLAQE